MFCFIRLKPLHLLATLLYRFSYNRFRLKYVYLLRIIIITVNERKSINLTIFSVYNYYNIPFK